MLQSNQTIIEEMWDGGSPIGATSLWRCSLWLVAKIDDIYAQHFKIILSFGFFTVWIIWIIA